MGSLNFANCTFSDADFSIAGIILGNIAQFVKGGGLFGVCVVLFIMIKSIMCCCGSGLGSSMLVRMNVEKTLQKIGVSGVSVTHSSLSDAAEGAADLFVVGKDLENFVKQLPRVVILDNIMDKTELENKLRTEFEK